MPDDINPFLVAAAILSATAAMLHLACIIRGATAFRFLGAGEHLASMAEQGHWYPNLIAVVIAGILFGWAAYALSGAGVIPHLPFLRLALVIITAIYLLRAFLFPLLKPAFPGNSNTFWLISSGICFLIGTIHLIGLNQVWEKL